VVEIIGGITEIIRGNGDNQRCTGGVGEIIGGVGVAEIIGGVGVVEIIGGALEIIGGVAMEIIGGVVEIIRGVAVEIIEGVSVAEIIGGVQWR